MTISGMVVYPTPSMIQCSLMAHAAGDALRPPINTARHGACAAAFAGYLYVWDPSDLLIRLLRARKDHSGKELLVSTID